MITDERDLQTAVDTFLTDPSAGTATYGNLNPYPSNYTAVKEETNPSNYGHACRKHEVVGYPGRHRYVMAVLWHRQPLSVHCDIRESDEI